MPIAGERTAEAPQDIVPGKACLYVRIVSDVNSVVDGDEVEGGRAPVNGEGADRQQRADHDRAIVSQGSLEATDRCAHHARY